MFIELSFSGCLHLPDYDGKGSEKRYAHQEKSKKQSCRAMFGFGCGTCPPLVVINLKLSMLCKYEKDRKASRLPGLQKNYSSPIIAYITVVQKFCSFDNSIFYHFKLILNLQAGGSVPVMKSL